MKKLFSIIACLICAAMLTTTGFTATSSDAYSIYKKAVSYLDTADSIELSGTIRNIMTMDNTEVLNTTEKSTIKVYNKTISRQDVNSDTKGTISTYYKDGYIYENSNGIKTKSKYSFDIALVYIGMLDTSIPKEFFKDATVENTADGTTIKFKIKYEDFPTTFSYTLKVGTDNKLKSYSTTFSMSSSSNGTMFKNKVTTTYKIASINKATKIDFPTDLSSYKTR